jgi:hypothetical protein
MTSKNTNANTNTTTQSIPKPESVTTESAAQSVTAMDELNKKAVKICSEKGINESVKFMFNPTGNRQLSYSEMRSRFG